MQLRLVRSRFLCLRHQLVDEQLLKRHLKPETLEKLLINELMPQTEETEADKPPFYIPRILKKRKEDDKDGAN